MLVAFASTDGIHITDHFGRCKCFYMYDLLEDSFVFVKAIDSTQELQEEGEKLAYKIGCIEEIAWRQGFISEQQLKDLAEPLKKSGYGEYLLGLLKHKL